GSAWPGELLRGRVALNRGNRKLEMAEPVGEVVVGDSWSLVMSGGDDEFVDRLVVQRFFVRVHGVVAVGYRGQDGTTGFALDGWHCLLENTFGGGGDRVPFRVQQMHFGVGRVGHDDPELDRPGGRAMADRG